MDVEDQFATDNHRDGGCVKEESDVMNVGDFAHGVLKAYLVWPDVSPG